MKKRLERRSLLLLFLLLIFCVAASIQINEKAKKKPIEPKNRKHRRIQKAWDGGGVPGSCEDRS